MDGLDVVRPVGDPAFAAARPTLASRPGLPLDGFFEMHPALEPLLPLWRAGELGFAHAVSTPYRDKRSHFDGQDMLEAGTGMDVPASALRDGWLNRMLQAMPELSGETAYAIGTEHMRLLSGPAPVRQWSPQAALEVTTQQRRLLEYLYEEDPLFHATAAEAIALAELGEADPTTERGMAVNEAMEAGNGGEVALAAFAAERLFNEARIASFSISGWDTHRRQAGAIARPLSRLAETLLTLKAGLGAAWGKTTVLAMTEFGRTVRENGTGGTDHGTGGAMLLAGGAVAGGKVYGQWPGLAEAALYKGRDLMPTGDVRAYAAWAMRGLYGLDRGLIESAIFPGLDMGRDPGLILG
jgi:uncharacterized protein (DUF1501 family)